MGRRRLVILASAAALAAATIHGCVVPNLKPIKGVEDVTSIVIGETTRAEVIDLLGIPNVAASDDLLVYNWEKSRTFWVMAAGSSGVGGSAGHKGFRVVVELDGKGHVREVLTYQSSEQPEPVSENWTTIRGCGVLDMPGAVELSPDAERVAVLIRQELCITSGDRASVKRIDLGKFPAVHHAQGRYIAWSPAGGQLAVAPGRQEVKLIDAATGDTIRTFGNRPEKGRLYYHLPRPVCFSPDGARLAVPDVDGSLVVWEVSTGKEFLRHQSAAVIGELTFSHDGARIGVGLHGGGFEVIDADDGRIILSRPPVSDSSVGAVVSFSPDGRLMAVGTPVHMELWQLPGLRRKATLLLPFYRHAPASNICDRPVIGFSGDGGTVAVLAGEMLTLIDSGSVVVRHQYRFQSVLVATFDPGWKRLAVLSSGGLRMWEVPEEMRLATVQE